MRTWRGCAAPPGAPDAPLVVVARVVVAALLIGPAAAHPADAGNTNDDTPPSQAPRGIPDCPAPVAREENPAPGVVWYADGRLHLDHVVLTVDGIVFAGSRWVWMIRASG